MLLRKLHLPPSAIFFPGVRHYCSSSSPKVVTRFAPSPTGFLHLGGFRTALFNYLYAKKYQGKFILRIEDTDQKRFVQGAKEQIEQILQWAQLPFDSQFIQSERTEIYRQFAYELVDKGHAYKCYCSNERLAKSKEEAEFNSNNTGASERKYDRRCLYLTEEEKKQFEQSGAPFVIRMKVPTIDLFPEKWNELQELVKLQEKVGDAFDEKSTQIALRIKQLKKEFSVTIEDQVFGKIVVQNEVVDDQVLLKSDGFPTYHLANVVDDHLMEVTHVVRGMEWISSTPKHILLYQMFGWQAPTFAHLALLTDTDGQKLSKRMGHASVSWYKEKGYLPEALVNFVAFLGWSPKEASTLTKKAKKGEEEEHEILTLPQLIERFNLHEINKANCSVNLKKLDWLNAQHIKLLIETDLERVVRDVKPELEKRYPMHFISDEYLKKVLQISKERVKKYSYFAEHFYFFFVEDVNFETEEAKGLKHKTIDAIPHHLKITEYALEALQQIKEDEFVADRIGQVINQLKDQHKYVYKDVGSVLRYYLTGSTIGPGINQMIETLGKRLVVKRLSTALQN